MMTVSTAFIMIFWQALSWVALPPHQKSRASKIRIIPNPTPKTWMGTSYANTFIKNSATNLVTLGKQMLTPRQG